MQSSADLLSTLAFNFGVSYNVTTLKENLISYFFLDYTNLDDFFF